MKTYLILICLMLSLELHGSSVRPCQKIGFQRVAPYTIPSYGISTKNRNRAIKLLKKCLHNNSVCIVEEDPQSKNWLSKELRKPVNDNNINPVDRRLIFGLVQYVDKKSGLSVCIAAINSFAHAVPWLGKSWVVNGENITEYDLYGDRFNTVMTPNTLYKALLASHMDVETQK